MSSDILARLGKLLAYDAHSRRYQAIPDFIGEKLGRVAAGYSSEQLHWDAPRYAWIDQALPNTVRSSVELGSSLGYFSLSLAKERGFAVEGFEPVKDYAEASNLFATLMGMQAQAKFHPRGIGINDIATLPALDCLITMNVLHHAGNIYDRDEVERRGGWLAYARDYLGYAAERFGHMIFQTGNVVKGDAHFPSEAAIDTLVPLLEASGWQIQSIGVIMNFVDLGYENFERASLEQIPRIGCWRNPDTGLVEYRAGGSILASLAYGSLQRPLFHCVRA